MTEAWWMGLFVPVGMAPQRGPMGRNQTGMQGSAHVTAGKKMRQFCRMEINGLDCFSGWSESIRRLSCCPPAPQQEGQQEEGRKNRQRCWWSRANSCAKRNLTACGKNIYKKMSFINYWLTSIWTVVVFMTKTIFECVCVKKYIILGTRHEITFKSFKN